MRTSIKTALTIAAAGGLILGLAACASTSPAPEPTKTTSTESAVAKAPKTGVCEDGQIIVTDKDLSKDKAFTVAADCAVVSILASHAKVTLTHDVKTLSLEGADISVDARSVGSIAAFGAGSTVRHTGQAPSVADTGTGVPTDLKIVSK